MSITVTCECGAEFRVRSEYAGKRTQCPTCGEILLIPTPEDAIDESEYEVYDVDLDEDDAHEDAQSFDSGKAPPKRLKRRRRSSRPDLSGWLRGFSGFDRTSGIRLLFIGLSLVVFTRGCDAIAKRQVSRAQALLKLEQNAFDDEWSDDRSRYETKNAELRSQIEELRQQISEGVADATATNKTISDLQNTIDENSQRIDDLREDEAEARAELERGRWLQMQRETRDAELELATGRYWHEWGFVIGTLLLTTGLLLLAFHGEPNERRVCLIMLAIITFSLYVGGFAWLDSLTLGR